MPAERRAFHGVSEPVLGLGSGIRPRHPRLLRIWNRDLGVWMHQRRQHLFQLRSLLKLRLPVHGGGRDGPLPCRVRRHAVGGACKILLALAAVAVPGLCPAGAGPQANSNRPGRVVLATVRTLNLRGGPQQIDRVAPLPGGSLVVRHSDIMHPQDQLLGIFGSNGVFRNKIAGYGSEPGQFVRPAGLAVSRDGTIWSADAIPRRVARFGPDGRLLSTTLVPRLAVILTLALDERRGLLYLGGCLPLHATIDRGCLLVHQFSLPRLGYLGSFVETDPRALGNQVTVFMRVSIDIDSSGRVWATDGPVMKLYRIDPGANRADVFVIRSAAAAPGPVDVTHGPVPIAAAHDRAFLVDRTLVTGRYVVVSILRPKSAGGYLLEVFDHSGRQVGFDGFSADRLVGRSLTGRLYFAHEGSEGTRLAEKALSILH